MMMMHRIEKSNLRTLRAKEGKKNERQKLHRDEKNFKNTSDSSFHFRENFHSRSALFSRVKRSLYKNIFFITKQVYARIYPP